MKNQYKFLQNLSVKQKEICLSDKNLIITACPGSGKTHTLTHKLAYLSKKWINSRKLNIAITYTNRAADEIEKRLLDMDIDMHNIWIGTIHQFCMKYILRPYSMYHKNLKKGYTIISQYNASTYLKQITKELNVPYYSENPYKYKENKVLHNYINKLNSNKQIDFNMILEYSYELLENNIFIGENVSNIIRSIQVDEYQDTNEIQYKILSNIVKYNSTINISFIGDFNQSIFSNLGGVAKNADEIKKIFLVDFEEKSLNQCYRSTQRIIDYYENYEIKKMQTYSILKNNDSIIKFNYMIKENELYKVIADIIKCELEQGVKENQICVIAPQWHLLYKTGENLKKLLPNNNFDSPNISPIKYEPSNIFFLISKILFTQNSKNSNNRFLRRKIANEILNILKEDFCFNIPQKITKLDILNVINSTYYDTNDDCTLVLEKCIQRFLKFLNIDLDENLQEMQRCFLDSIIYRATKYKLFIDCYSVEKSFNPKMGIVLNTIHGVKGEEFVTVIAFGLLNGYLPHWDYIYNKNSNREDYTKKMMYVLCSRAKKNLYLFSESDRLTKNKHSLYPTDELKNLNFDYDE